MKRRIISSPISEIDETPSTPPSDYQGLPLSDSPPQWEEEDCDGTELWEVENVISEEIDIFNKKKYQIKWADWKRPDGTSTTWEYALQGNDNLLLVWGKHAERQRKKAAQASLDISMQRISSSLPHDIHTAESAEAYKEKLKLWKDRKQRHPSPDQTDWRDEVEQLKKQRTSNDPTPGKKRKRAEEVQIVLPGPEQVSPKPPLDLRVLKEKIPLARPSRRQLKLGQRSSSPKTDRSPSTSKRFVSEIEKSWNKAALRAGAAGICIVNEVDEDEHPVVSNNFQYLESTRLYDTDVMPPEAYADFMSGCDCKNLCNFQNLACACQVESQCNDIHDKPTRAYDKNGLFLFTDHGEVVECNTRCSCSKTCGNKIAQRPRDFPIVIFKTSKLGWGVRTQTNIPEGKVLGLYTGRVITREKAGDLDAYAQEYTFALDLRDDDPEFERQYTIDAHEAGNWTRFVNHSCDPTAKIYNVIFDTVREANMPNIAFVAVKHMPPGTEITIDYNPAATLAALLGKGKGKAPRGRAVCLCGSPNCRGYL